MHRLDASFVGGVAEQEPDPQDLLDALSVIAAARENRHGRDCWSATTIRQARDELRAVRADLLTTRRQLEAVNQQAESLGGPVGQMVKFAAKHGQLQRDLKCDDCSAGDHYHCAHGQPSYPRCCCPERLDLNQ